jgi:hypothetical protein
MVRSSLVTHKVGNALIGQRVTDGYIHATALCQAAGRELKTYLRSQNVSEFLDELSRSVQICTDLLVQKIMTGPNELRGTWVHPHVAIHLAQWCSARFAVLVTQWVYEWLTTGQVQPRPTLNTYKTRIGMAWKMAAGVPKGYWTVFDKCSSLLILVECELRIPVEQYDLLDGSVGTRWKNFRADKPWAGERQHYRHIFPDKRGVDARDHPPTGSPDGVAGSAHEGPNREYSREPSCPNHYYFAAPASALPLPKLQDLPD